MIATTTQFQHAEEESLAPEHVPFTAIMTNSSNGEALTHFTSIQTRC